MEIFKLWLKDEAQGEDEDEEEEEQPKHTQKTLNNAQDTSFNENKPQDADENTNAYPGLPQSKSSFINIYTTLKHSFYISILKLNFSQFLSYVRSASYSFNHS